MDKNKIPHKGDFSVSGGKDFFAGADFPVPNKSAVPHKPVDQAISQTTITPDSPKETPVTPSEAPLLPSVMPQKTTENSFDKKAALENNKKSFEHLSEGLPQLRTYRQDVAGVMRDKKTSLVHLVLEEQKERNRREKEKSPTSKKNLPLILLSAVFLFSTVGLVYYIYFRINPVDHTLSDMKVTPLIFVEKNHEISVGGKDSRALIGEIVKILQGDNLKVDVIEYLFFTETINTQTQKGTVSQKNLISADRFFDFVGVKIPPMLLRSLRPDFMFGLHSFNKNQPFLILKTDYYDNAFAGILSWESKLPEDILPFFGRADRVAELSQRTWGDTVIKNKDTRVLRNFDGSIALVYAFKDQYTLIITTNEDTLLEVSHRLDLSQEKRPE